VIAVSIPFNNVSRGEDSLISDEKPMYKRVGNCVHVTTRKDGLEKYDGSWIALGANTVSPGSSAYYVQVRAHPRYIVGASKLQEVPAPHTEVEALSLTGLGAQASKRLNALALANSIWETKDFPGMLDLVKRRERIGDILTGHRLSDSPTWRRILKLSDRVRPLKTAKRMLQFGRLLRDEGLGWALGWAPTIRDVQNIRKELPKAWNERKQNFKPFTVHRSDFQSNTTSGQYVDGATFDYDLIEDVRRVAGLRCVPPQPKDYYFDRFRQADKLIANLVGNPLTVIWEAVPWSFVIDWFVSIDDLIGDSYLRGLSGYELTAWTSSKQDSRITWSGWAYTSCNPSTGALTGYNKFDWTHSRTTYIRTPATLPSLLTNVRFRAGPKQAFLGILLGLGLIDRPRGGR
jgi:hypothetical protein